MDYSYYRCLILTLFATTPLDGFVPRINYLFRGRQTKITVPWRAATTTHYYVVDWERPDKHNETTDTWSKLKIFFRRNYGRKTVPMPKQGDALWWMCDSDDRSILASLRMVAPSRDGFYFLRYVCVASTHRRQGFATRLLQDALSVTSYDNDDRYQPHNLYCFAEPKLRPLYEAVGFDVVATTPVTSIDESDSTDGHSSLPPWMKDQYKRLARRLESRGVNVSWFVKRQRACAAPVVCPTTSLSLLRVILLQHANEAHRPTSTGHLCNEFVNLTIWKWSGRADNDRIAQSIDNARSPVLLWTDKSSSNSYVTTSNLSRINDENRDEDSSSASTFIILDGTWQEAQSMYRKIPALHNLPRQSFRTSTNATISSNYTLRGNYGWKDKWKTSNDRRGAASSSAASPVALLCTAEVICLLLEQRHQEDRNSSGTSNEQAAQDLRQRLSDFQRDYYREQAAGV